jgi:tetraacyldisaccharide 4'-kinase
MKHKFPQAVVAVDENRRRGIERLLALKEPRVEVILLDDAYQHRRVAAGLNIVLTDYNRLYCDDALLPAGRLREPASRRDRAQVVIVTKCPSDLKPIDYNILGKRLALRPHQQLYFSTVMYGELTPVFPEGGLFTEPLEALSYDEEILLVTGIATPDQLTEKLRKYTLHVHQYAFGDHHAFTKKDIKRIIERFNGIDAVNKRIVTTEKDATRLRMCGALLDEDIRQRLYMIPIKIEILRDKESALLHTIIDNYVSKNSRNG